MLGAALALVSAIFFGMNSATVRRGVLKSTVLQAMAITVPLGIPIFAVFAWFMGGYQAVMSWEMSAWNWMALAGVTHFVVGRYGNYRATQALGATLSTPVQQLSILVALILAFVFLGETVNVLNVIGIVLVTFGPMLLVKRRGSVAKSGKAKGFEPELGPGMFWGAICALGYGASPLFVTLGLGAMPSYADGAIGLLISYCAATIVVLAWLWMVGGRAYMANLDKASMYWFMLSTVLVALSQMFRYLALTVAPVTVVVPIQRLSVVFRLFFNAAINREHEVFDRGIIFSIVLSVVGAVALTMDSVTLLSFMGLGAEQMQLLVTPLF